MGEKNKARRQKEGGPKEVTLKSCPLLTASCQSCSLSAIGGIDPFSIIFLYALCSKHDSQYLKLIFQPHGQYFILEIQLTPMNSLCKPQPPSVPALFFVWVIWVSSIWVAHVAPYHMLMLPCALEHPSFLKAGRQKLKYSTNLLCAWPSVVHVMSDFSLKHVFKIGKLTLPLACTKDRVKIMFPGESCTGWTWDFNLNVIQNLFYFISFYTMQ